MLCCLDCLGNEQSILTRDSAKKKTAVTAQADSLDWISVQLSFLSLSLKTQREQRQRPKKNSRRKNRKQTDDRKSSASTFYALDDSTRSLPRRSGNTTAAQRQDSGRQKGMDPMEAAEFLAFVGWWGYRSITIGRFFFFFGM